MEPSSSLSSLAGAEDGYCPVEHVKTKAETILHRMMALDFSESAITLWGQVDLVERTRLKGCVMRTLSLILSLNTTMICRKDNSLVSRNRMVHSTVEAHAKLNLPGMKAFVPQDDRLHRFYTAKSSLQNYSRLSGISRQVKLEELEARIDKLLQQLGLAEQTDTIVGNLFLKGFSGGQQRRLSVALEAWTEPRKL